MLLQNIIKKGLFFGILGLNFLFIYADEWQKVIKPDVAPKGAVKIGERREKKEAEDTGKKPVEKSQNMGTSTLIRPVATEEKAQKETDSDSAFKRFKDFVFGFGKTAQKSDEAKKTIKQPQFVAKKTEDQAKIAQQKMIAQQARVFVSTSKMEFSTVQKDWLECCDVLQKDFLKQLKGVDQEDLPDAIKELTEIMNVLRKGFSTQAEGELQTTIEKLEKLVKSVEGFSPKVILSEQENTRKFVEKSKDMIAEMQKLMKQKNVDEEAVEKEASAQSKARPFIPGPERKAKIAQGTKVVATLAQNPEKIVEMLPKRPSVLDRLLDPEKCKNITPAELYRMQNDPEIQRYLKEYLIAVEAIGEHFLAVAKQKAPDYTSGTVVIEDKNGKLHEFLHSYVEMTNKLSKGPQADVEKPSFVAGSKAYGRISSHFGRNYRYGSQASREEGKPSHYGIDLDNPIKTVTVEKPQPDEVRSHLLFGKIEADRPFLFMKFETHGLGDARDTAIHTVNYARRMGAMIVEKAQAKATSKKNTTSDKPTDSGKFTVKDRRENTPKIILEEYRKLLKTSGLSKKDQSRFLDEARSCGVSSILRQIKDKEQFKAFEEKIRRTYSNKTYGDGNLDIRMGNEIIIRDRDLQQLRPPA